MSSEHQHFIELSLFSLNNVTRYITSVEVLVSAKQYGHGAGLALVGIEEFVRAMNFYLLGVADLSHEDSKKLRTSNSKISSGSFTNKFDKALDTAMQIILTNWLQAKPESFEIFANYLTAKTEFEKETFLNVMIEYLQGDSSEYALNFNTLLAVKSEKSTFHKVKSDIFFRIDKNNSLPLTAGEEDTEKFLNILRLLDNFGTNITDFFRDLFLKSNLFNKYKKFDNNVRLIWPDIFKHF